MRSLLLILAAALVGAAGLVGATGSPADARHSWGKYHWGRASNPFTLKLGDNVSSTWDGHLSMASSDWSKSTVLDTTIVPGGTTGSTCAPTSGRVEVCNGAYGNTGWLGVAQIWVFGTHIAQGTVKNNDTYFGSPPYDTPAWRQMVMCQEVGHTFGLAHQDENFSNPDLVAGGKESCMDYTSNPDGNGQPNQHDYDQLETIYAHLDATTTVASVPAASAAAVADDAADAAWGRLVEVTNQGQGGWYVRDLGAGNLILTHVFWANR